MNGYGIFVWPDKKKYYGNYINNLKEGFGFFYWNNEHKYEGFWKWGKQHKYGILTGHKENKFGYWIDGKLQSKINDDETINFIIETINNVKKTEGIFWISIKYTKIWKTNNWWLFESGYKYK